MTAFRDKDEAMDLDRLLQETGEETRPGRNPERAAVMLARETTRRRSRRHVRTVIATISLSIAVVGAGGAALALEPSLVPWIKWIPDQQTEHVIELNDGTRYSCPIVFRVVPQYAGEDRDEVDKNVEEVREYFDSLDFDRIVTDPELLEEEQRMSALPGEQFADRTELDEEYGAWLHTLGNTVGHYVVQHRLVGISYESAGDECTVIQ